MPLRENATRKERLQGRVERIPKSLQESGGRKSLPDYDIALDEENDQVIFTNKKNALTGQEKEGDGFPALEPETYNDARIVASGYDVYYLEEEWRDWWVDSGKPPLSNPDKAFIGFCKAGYEKNPNP